MNSINRRIVLLLFIQLLSDFCIASSYNEDDFKGDWSSPFIYEKSKNILIWGSSITLLLVANRENFVNPLQEDIAEDEPLGKFSVYGDYAGQLVPNLIYMSYQYSQNNSLAKSRAKLMLKASFFSGMTTFFLKRIINQRRPDGHDRNSHPSGHTTTAFAFASVITTQHPNWTVPAYALASFVGLSRMNDNAHYLHDVVMGATIGMAYGYALDSKAKEDASIQTLIMPLNDGAMISLNYLFE